MEIEMMGSEFKEFSDIFDKLYIGLEPLYAVIGSIERTMASSGFNYFKLPAFKSRDLKNHYFIFTVEENQYIFSKCM